MTASEACRVYLCDWMTKPTVARGVGGLHVVRSHGIAARTFCYRKRLGDVCVDWAGRATVSMSRTKILKLDSKAVS
jgi:hypothetical protein